MLVLEEEQGSPAPGAIERTLLDHAYSGHPAAVTASLDEQPPGWWTALQRIAFVATLPPAAVGAHSRKAARLGSCNRPQKSVVRGNPTPRTNSETHR